MLWMCYRQYNIEFTISAEKRKQLRNKVDINN